mgnify:FL=1
MARPQRNKQLRPLHLFICEDSKSSKYYMQGLGRAKGINIKAEEADGTSPENVLKSAKEKQKLFKDEGTVQIYCLFDKDDCDDEKFKKAIQQCRKAGFVDAVSVPCYEYWLLLHLKKTNQPFRDAKECCETFQSEYNKKFQTQYTVKQLKAKTDIFNDLNDNLDSAIANADNLELEEASCPYTNMHSIIKKLLKHK